MLCLFIKSILWFSISVGLLILTLPINLVSALSGSCHLFRRCDLQCGCRGCVSGPRDCEAECRVPPVRGEGVWYCDGHNNTVTQVRDNNFIYMVMLSCVTGPAYQDLWQLFLQVWGQAPADGDLPLRGLGPGRGIWPHQICLSSQVSRWQKPIF